MSKVGGPAKGSKKRVAFQLEDPEYVDPNDDVVMDDGEGEQIVSAPIVAVVLAAPKMTEEELEKKIEESR